MPNHLAPLHEAFAALDAAWGESRTTIDLSRTQLVAVNEALGMLQRRLDGVRAEVAAGIARESRTELGADSLAKQHGFRTPAKLIAATSGGSTGDAARLVKVGEAIAPRANLIGEPLPAKYPSLQAAMTGGTISASAAALIVALLDRCRIAVGAERVAEAERLLSEQAAGLCLDDVRKLIVRAEAWLDPDGVEPREEDLRSKRSATMFQRDGHLHVNLVLDAESAAPVIAAVNGFVTATFQARKDAPEPDAPDADHRTVQMLRADAFSAICAHALACEEKRLPLAGATVVVRMGLNDLQSGDGTATIDGIDQPISIAAARRMAADGGVIPCVLGGDSEILDWGREKRLFTRRQKLALVERDGGCAMCGIPPDLARVHHLAWWERDTGPTDLANGVLLCETCHHRIHDNGWEIRIDGVGIAAKVWFIPPPEVDPARRPRLGGRARYDIAA